jgi:DNA-binding protein Fis
LIIDGVRNVNNKLLIFDDELDVLELLKNVFQEQMELFLGRESDAALRRIAAEKSEHNQVVAAKLLGVSRNILRGRLERYGIDSSRPSARSM